MVKPTGVFLISAIFLTTMVLSIWAVDAATSGSHEVGLYFPALVSSCNEGSIEECLMDNEEGEEVEMDSESNRRILVGRRRYISYGALIRNRVPCSRRGYSYYNCRPGRPVNPYNRGCSAITRCRSF